jgi:hypothetical protein
MANFLAKLFLGKALSEPRTPTGVLAKRVRNLKAIWNNEHQNDIGIERVLRLVLAGSQFLFPGTYVRHFFGRYGVALQDLSVDLFVLLKIAFPLTLLYLGLEQNTILFAVLMWFLAETMLYVPTLIFASDIFTRPRSYRRSLLFLFFNYVELVCGFGVIYAGGEYLNKPAEQWFDPIYFSFITSATVGFGDYYPVTPLGKVLVCIQSTVILVFVVLFINFYSNRIESKGYFDQNSSR